MPRPAAEAGSKAQCDASGLSNMPRSGAADSSENGAIMPWSIAMGAQVSIGAHINIPHIALWNLGNCTVYSAKLPLVSGCQSFRSSDAAWQGWANRLEEPFALTMAELPPPDIDAGSAAVDAHSEWLQSRTLGRRLRSRARCPVQF